MMRGGPQVIAARWKLAIGVSSTEHNNPSRVREPSIVSDRSSDCEPTTDGPVTALHHAGVMTDIHPQAAVCVVRVERQDAGLLITLVINADIDQVSKQQLAYFADIDAALDAIRHFLVQFTE